MNKENKMKITKTQLKRIIKEELDELIDAMNNTFEQKKVTYDFHRQMNNATLLKCSEFGEAIIKNMD